MKPPIQDIRVLVVDDSPVSRKLLEHTLDAAPYSLLFAKDGSDALRLFTERPPELVIADWELPDIPGPELCRIVRIKFDSAYTYLMLLTSNSDKKSIAEEPKPKRWHSTPAPTHSRACPTAAPSRNGR